MDIFNLAYNYEGEKNYFASIHLQGEDQDRELIFKFIWQNKLKPKNFYNTEKQESIDIKNIDHISFHNNGQILLTYNNKFKKSHFYEKKLPYPITALPKNSYIPILIFSINELTLFTKYFGRQNIFDNADNVADLTYSSKTNFFSVCVFVVRNNFQPIFLKELFPGIFDIKDNAYFPYAINSEIGLLMVYSKKLILPKDKNYINPDFFKNTIEIGNYPPIGLSLVPTDNRIRNLSSLNL